MDAVAITPNQKYAVVVDDGGEVAGNIVYVVNLPSLQVLNSVSVGIGSGYFLNSMAISPDSSVAYVVNGGFGDGQLIPVSIPTATVGGVIDVGGGPLAVTLSSNGNTAYVVDGAVGYGNLVVPVDLSQGFSYPNRTGGTPYQVGGDVNAYMDAIQLTQNQKVAYVTDRENGFLYPIDLAAGLASKPIYVGNSPVAVELI
jgi:DNA-binding beta-propeller fold protein YncE